MSMHTIAGCRCALLGRAAGGSSAWGGSTLPAQRSWPALACAPPLLLCSMRTPSCSVCFNMARTLQPCDLKQLHMQHTCIRSASFFERVSWAECMNWVVKWCSMSSLQGGECGREAGGIKR